MPAPEEILALLETISNELMLVAGVFHILSFAFIIALAAGWRPSKRIAGVMLSIPLLSVSVIAWRYGNPFNGAIFSVFFLLLFFYSFKLRSEVTITKGWMLLPVTAMVLFALFYPHFLQTSPFMYLIAAPTGLIPCPTLSLIIGLALLFNNFNSKTWGVTLSVIGLFYGVFGLLKLHVYIDGALLAGSLILLIITLRTSNTWKLARGDS